MNKVYRYYCFNIHQSGVPDSGIWLLHGWYHMKLAHQRQLHSPLWLLHSSEWFNSLTPHHSCFIHALTTVALFTHSPQELYSLTTVASFTLITNSLMTKASLTGGFTCSPMVTSLTAMTSFTHCYDFIQSLLTSFTHCYNFIHLLTTVASLTTVDLFTSLFICSPMATSLTTAISLTNSLTHCSGFTVCSVIHQCFHLFTNGDFTHHHHFIHSLTTVAWFTSDFTHTPAVTSLTAAASLTHHSGNVVDFLPLQHSELLANSIHSHRGLLVRWGPLVIGFHQTHLRGRHNKGHGLTQVVTCGEKDKAWSWLLHAAPSVKSSFSLLQSKEHVGATHKLQTKKQYLHV